MKFNKKHLVIINTLSNWEAIAFIQFLESEIIRHQDDIEAARKLIKLVKEKLAK